MSQMKVGILLMRGRVRKKSFLLLDGGVDPETSNLKFPRGAAPGPRRRSVATLPSTGRLGSQGSFFV